MQLEKRWKLDVLLDAAIGIVGVVVSVNLLILCNLIFGLAGFVFSSVLSYKIFAELLSELRSTNSLDKSKFTL